MIPSLVRASASDPLEGSEAPALARPTWAQLWVALGLWALPIAVAWLQFELLLEVVWMFPMATLAAGAWLGTVVGRRLGPPRSRRAGAMAGLVVLGIPAGLLGFYMPMKHFNAHLTEVRTVSLDDDFDAPTRRYHRFSAELPPFPELPPPPPMPMFEVSEPIDLETLMKDGDVVLRDGELYTRQADGSFLPMDGGSEALLAAFVDQQDARVERKREAIREAQRQWKEEVDRRRRGGRLFSSP